MWARGPALPECEAVTCVQPVQPPLLSHCGPQATGGPELAGSHRRDGQCSCESEHEQNLAHVCLLPLSLTTTVR